MKCCFSRPRADEIDSKKNNGPNSSDVSVALKGAKKVVLVAVARSGRALEYASADLRGDREVVLAAVVRSGLALQHVSEELQNDSTVQRQRQYLATRDGVTGRILLRLYRAELSLYIAEQRLAFAKLLSRRLGEESNIPDQACYQDIIESIVNTGVLTFSVLVPGFEACVNYSMKSKPEGLSSDDNIQDVMHGLIRESCGQKGLGPEQLLPDRGDSGRIGVVTSFLIWFHFATGRI